MKRISVRMATVAMLLAGAILAAGSAGCSKEEPAPRPVVQKPAPKPADNAVSARKPSETEGKTRAGVALYDPAGKRDPFVPFLKAEPQHRAKADLAVLPPLERYELGELKYVGAIWGKKGARALVEDGEGKGYGVTVGTRIGRSGGVVTRITDKEITVREEFVGVRGDKVQRENALQLTTAGGK
jgi:Tfp pilus assembly protein PilP